MSLCTQEPLRSLRIPLSNNRCKIAIQLFAHIARCVGARMSRQAAIVSGRGANSQSPSEVSRTSRVIAVELHDGGQERYAPAASKQSVFRGSVSDAKSYLKSELQFRWIGCMTVKLAGLGGAVSWS